MMPNNPQLLARTTYSNSILNSIIRDFFHRQNTCIYFNATRKSTSPHLTTDQKSKLASVENIKSKITNGSLNPFGSQNQYQQYIVPRATLVVGDYEHKKNKNVNIEILKDLQNSLQTNTGEENMQKVSYYIAQIVVLNPNNAISELIVPISPLVFLRDRGLDACFTYIADSNSLLVNFSTFDYDPIYQMFINRNTGELKSTINNNTLVENPKFIKFYHNYYLKKWEQNPFFYECLSPEARRIIFANMGIDNFEEVCNTELVKMLNG